MFYASINEQKTARHCPRDYSEYDGLNKKDISKVESSATIEHVKGWRTVTLDVNIMYIFLVSLKNLQF